jgi:ABC-type Mn2+/Zn2+ transport system ATPase subunit
MTEKQVVLKTTGLSLGYDDRTVLQDVNIEVHSGEFWVFLGQNGGGKSTLLRSILGLLQPKNGHIWLHPDRAAVERIGFVPQRCDLNPTLPITVQEFVLLGLVGIRARKAEQQARLCWALEKTGLERLAAHSYWSLSGGQRQRALVARALVRQPALLILDEPTNNLDPPAEEALLQLFVGWNNDARQTLLFVTHKIAIAARYATHVALFHSGTVLAGPRSSVLTRGNLQRIYGIEADAPSAVVDPEGIVSLAHGAAG